MSLSENPPVKITSHTAKDISDEILGGVIEFFKLSVVEADDFLVTFFWSAFLFSARKELDDQNLTKKIMDQFIVSFSDINLRLRNNPTEQKSFAELQREYFKMISDELKNVENNLVEAFDLIQITNQVVADFMAPIKYKTAPYESFLMVSEVINSNIHSILRQIKNDFATRYIGNLNEVVFIEKIQKVKLPPQYKSFEKEIIAAQSGNKKEQYKKPLGMAWYKFLVCFGLIFGGIVNILYGINCISGSIYDAESNGKITAQEVYDYYGKGLQVVDITYGIFLIAFAIFAFVLRHKLVNYKSDAPKLTKIFYSIFAVAPFLYTVAVAMTANQQITFTAVVTLIIGLIFLFANIRYFNRRAHLFVNGATKANVINTQTTINTPPSNTPPQSSRLGFCVKCGVRISDESEFCHNCGAKL